MNAASFAERLADLRERMAQAATRAGRASEAITLIAVSKNVPVERMAEAYAAGVRDFGESYVQEALLKIGQPPLHDATVRWHFIGHLQRNKVKPVLAHFPLIHSVDSLGLAQEIARRAQNQQHQQNILLEVQLDPAGTKFGFAPEETLAAAEQIMALPGLRLCGLMGMAPYAANPEIARPYFRTLYTLFTRLPSEAQQHLSMGMTHDFEVAIEEGATLIRIGTALFGARV
jgi:pyridoxal phosphate enzyme (YggS family)